MDRRLAAILIVLAAIVSTPVYSDELYKAVNARDAKRVFALLNSGADPNERSPYDGPLHVAFRLGPPEIVAALARPLSYGLFLTSLNVNAL